MSHKTIEHSGGAGAIMRPSKLLRILLGYLKPYRSRAVLLILQREQLQKLMHQHAGLGAQVREALQRRMAQTDAMTA